ncbi:MAG: hypothetical protein RIF33_03420 [Cyclobacteriaceae bacterium]
MIRTVRLSDGSDPDPDIYRDYRDRFSDNDMIESDDIMIMQSTTQILETDNEE